MKSILTYIFIFTFLNDPVQAAKKRACSRVIRDLSPNKLAKGDRISIYDDEDEKRITGVITQMVEDEELHYGENLAIIKDSRGKRYLINLTHNRIEEFL